MSLEYPFLLNVSKYLENEDNNKLNQVHNLGQKINFNPVCFEIIFMIVPPRINFIATSNYPVFNIHDFDDYDVIYCELNIINMLGCDLNNVIELLTIKFNKKMKFKICLIDEFDKINFSKLERLIKQFANHEFIFYITSTLTNDSGYLFINQYRNLRFSDNSYKSDYEDCIGFINRIMYYDVMLVDDLNFNHNVEFNIKELKHDDDRLDMNYYLMKMPNCTITIKNNVLPYFKIICKTLNLPNCTKLNGIIECKQLYKPKLINYSPLLIIDSQILKQFHDYAFNLNVFEYENTKLIDCLIVPIESKTVMFTDIINQITLLKNMIVNQNNKMIIGNFKLKKIDNELVFEINNITLIIKNVNEKYKYKYNQSIYVKMSYEWLNYYNEFLKMFGFNNWIIDISTLTIDENYDVLF